MDAPTSPSADFGRVYWRSAPPASTPLPELSASSVDDASFRLLADNVPTLCWIANGDGYIVWYNRRWHDYCGTTPEQMEGWGWQSVHEPDLLPGVMARWTAAIANGEPFEMTFPLRGADNVFRPFLTRIQPVRDINGTVARWFGTNTEIFDQVAAETALRAERDRSRGVLESMAEGFVLLDRGYRVLDINFEGLRIDGRSRDAVVGRSHWEVWPGSEETEQGRLYQRVVAEGAAGQVECYYRWDDGHEVWLDVRAYPHPEGVAIFYRDITDRKVAEDALRTSEKRLRDLNTDLERRVIERSLARGRTWQLSPELLGVINAEGYFENSNPAWATLLGWSEDEVASTVFLDFVHPDDLARTRAAWREATERGLPALRLENRYRTRSGHWRWLSWVAVPEDDKVYCSARDVTAEKEREAELATRTAERDRLWTLAEEMLARANYSGMMTAVNPAWTKVLGFAEGELLSRPYVDFMHPEDAGVTLAALQSMSETGQATRFENRIKTRQGQWKSVGWTVAPEPDGVNFIAVGRDLSDDKAREAELAAAQDALRQSQKMEAVGQLTGGIAHDFNNMLAVVIGSLDLLGRRIGTGDARAKRYVDAASDGARRAALLTQRLLAFSRQQPLRPEAIDVSKLVTGMSDLIRGSMGSDVRIETVLVAGGWRTHADPNQLENVLLNLAVNARDAMPDGGRLTIETQNAHIDARYAAKHLGVPAGQYVLIAVSDTGSGMPEDVIAKAFDPFFTTKAVGKGTGLGLSQVYGFVKQSGGHVKIYSERGQGTTVKVYLPRLVGSADEDVEDDGTSEMPLGEAQEVILVVEDEPAVRQFSVDALTELGYRVLEADGAAAAFRLLDTHPEIALMFTDVVMPDINGRKLADEARQRRPDLKVLFTTGYTRNAVVHNGVLDPGVELIGKPFTIEELAAKVREVLDAPWPAAG